MKPAQNNLLLELHVPDFKRTKIYYRELGFKVVWSRQRENAADYLVMRRDNVILCFWPGNEEVYKQKYFSRFKKNTKRGYGVEVIVMVHDIGSFYNRVKDTVNVVEPIKLQPWGLRDFRAVDPFGYYIRFTEPHDILSKKNAVP